MEFNKPHHLKNTNCAFEKEKRCIPIFLHIPKSAGTYVLSWNINMFRKHSIIQRSNSVKNHKLRLIKVFSENQLALHAFVYDTNFTSDSTNKAGSIHIGQTSIYDFIIDLEKGKIELFSLIVESYGFKLLFKNIINTICKCTNTNPVYYCLLRDSFTRARSIYNYLKSFESSHESTHGRIKSETFEEYLSSHELEDSWLIRCINGMQDSQPISGLEFKKTCEFLDNVKIKKMELADSLINEIFYSCYELTIESSPHVTLYINKNESNRKTNKIDLSNIDPTKIELFINRTKYDNMIYNRYCV